MSETLNVKSAPAVAVQRVVSWPLFWMLWSIVFGTFAGTCWATGTGTPTLQAFCAGLHIGFAAFWLKEVVKAS